MTIVWQLYFFTILKRHQKCNIKASYKTSFIVRVKTYYKLLLIWGLIEHCSRWRRNGVHGVTWLNACDSLIRVVVWEVWCWEKKKRLWSSVVHFCWSGRQEVVFVSKWIWEVHKGFPSRSSLKWVSGKWCRGKKRAANIILTMSAFADRSADWSLKTWMPASGVQREGRTGR